RKGRKRTARRAAQPMEEPQMKLFDRLLGKRPAATARPVPRAGYLRDTRSAVISTRPSVLRDHRDDVQAAWQRAAGIALNLIQNSGRLRGAADQVIADTVGAELVLNPQPDFSGLGISDEMAADLLRT